MIGCGECMCVCMYVCVHVCMYVGESRMMLDDRLRWVYVCVCVCMYVCMYVGNRW